MVGCFAWARFGDRRSFVCCAKERQGDSQAHRRLQRKASKKQMITRPGTFEFAKYVIVFTTCSSGSTEDVLGTYRMRWQIELVFKRLKSLAQLGHLPKHDDRSSRAWLYGKLFVTLLAQKLMRIGRDISPAGYPLWARRTMESVA
ncbi:MAG: hypothetical protein DMG78_02430 [Acidobacteria bacterium]|nr:MAG: hypothetical protein DMG78_02430 [Acidobacteriota bacterium]